MELERGLREYVRLRGSDSRDKGDRLKREMKRHELERVFIPTSLHPGDREASTLTDTTVKKNKIK